MAENFNYQQYFIYIDQMVALLDNLMDPSLYRKINDSSKPVMELLRVAMMDNNYRDNPGLRQINEVTTGMPPYIKVAEEDPTRSVTVIKQVNENVMVRISAFQYKGDPDWTEEHKQLVQNFLNLYFNIIGRVRIFEMFNTRLFQDQDMPFVGNMRALMRDLRHRQMAGAITRYGIFRMNISRFSRFNKSFGRSNADKIMNTYIHLLVDTIGEDGGVYRLGGDNFVGLFCKDKLMELKDFLAGVEFRVNDDLPEISISSRAGCYLISEKDILMDVILNRVNATFMKMTPKEVFVFFDPSKEIKDEEAKMIENDINQAMAKGTIVPYYQPKIYLENEKIMGAEALCRWIKEDEVVPPMTFIPIMEHTNRICELDFYMLSKVCEDMKAWIDSGNKPVRVSVNFSRNNLADNQFVDKIIATIDRYQVPHDMIEVELTETTLEVDFQEVSNVVNRLKEAGVRTAVDDFGMGYSSLNLIKDIKWDVLKIDKNFVPSKQDQNYHRYYTMLKSVIVMANEIGMTSIVEGVETKEQLEIVKSCNCKVVQGYYFDKPLCKKDFEHKLLKGNTNKGIFGR